jgi:hypothetical protein
MRTQKTRQNGNTTITDSNRTQLGRNSLKNGVSPCGKTRTGNRVKARLAQHLEDYNKRLVGMIFPMLIAVQTDRSADVDIVRDCFKIALVLGHEFRAIRETIRDSRQLSRKNRQVLRRALKQSRAAGIAGLHFATAIIGAEQSRLCLDSTRNHN